MIVNTLPASNILLIGIAIGIFIDICLHDGIMCTKKDCEYRTYEME